MGKSELESGNYRKQGNQLYLNRSFHDALDAYGKSILFAPESSESLAYAFGNRSAIFCELKMFKHSLRDIQRSLSCRGCPNGLKEKLLARQKKCEAEKSDAPVELKLGGELMTYQEEVDEIPDIEGGLNAKFKGTTGKIALEYDPTLGRRFVATERIDIGSVIIVEQPYAATLFGRQWKQYCQWYYFRCPTCTEVKFCSEICLEKGWIGHAWECCQLGGASTEHELLMLDLPYKVFAVTPAKDLASNFSCQHRACEHEQPSFDGVYGLMENEAYNGGYQCLWNLTSHHIERKSNNIPLTKEIARAVENLSKLVRSNGQWPKIVEELFERSPNVCDECKSAPNEHKVKLASAYVTNTFERIIDILICNSHSIILDLQKTGTGIYPVASLINHSCVPNAFQSFVKNIMVIRATKTIKAGEEIRLCYGPRFGQQLTHERKEILKEKYYFDCACSGCTEPEFVEKEKSFTAINCRRCQSEVEYRPGVFYSQDTAVVCQDPMFKVGDNYVCPICSAQLPASPVEAKTQAIVKALESCIGKSDQPSTDDQEAEVTKLLSSLSNILNMENKELSEWRIKVAKWVLKRNPSPKWLARLERELYQKAFRFGHDSMEFAHEIHQFMDATMKASEKREDGLKAFISQGGSLLYERCQGAMAIFAIFFGPNCRMIQELNHSTVTLLSKCFTPDQGDSLNVA